MGTMQSLRSFRALAFAAVTACALAGCPRGGPPPADGSGPLNQPPMLTEARGQVRTIAITTNPEQRPAMTPALCTLEGYLFEATNPQSPQPMAREGDCALYLTPPDLALESQRWICAGSLLFAFGSRNERLTLCREPGDPLRPTLTIPCDGLTAGTAVRVSSAPDELPGDVVGDLATEVAVPGDVVITAPTNLGVTGWPVSGALDVRWTSADATAALVTLDARDATVSTARIVCRPTTLGTVTVPELLITQSGLRLLDTILRVSSYRGLQVTAEMGMTYRVSAGISATVALQGQH
jgi:hypothetical protein